MESMTTDTAACEAMLPGSPSYDLTRREIVFPAGEKRTLYGVESFTGQGGKSYTAMISFDQDTAGVVIRLLKEYQVHPSQVENVVTDLQTAWLLDKAE